MNKEISIEEFLELKEHFPAFDVRTPAEYQEGHIPGCKNLPLFSNEERAVVGTIYKQKGRKEAVYEGLKIVSPKIISYINTVIQTTETDTLLFHCWRGGMRSSSMAWLFDTFGKQTYTLSGGYRAYRRLANNSFEIPKKIIILGGLTGSGKTEILHELAQKGEKIIDLENLANHKGSSFGAIGEQAQPSTEHFNNLIFEQWRKLGNEDVVWLEDESHLVGTCFINDSLWGQMRKASVVKIECSKESRINRLIRQYTVEDKEKLIEATLRIQKKLGGQHAKAAIEAIENEKFDVATDIILTYYDKTYLHGILQRKEENINTILWKDELSVEEITSQLIEFRKNNY